MLDFKLIFGIGVNKSVQTVYFRVKPEDYFIFLEYLVKNGCNRWVSGEMFNLEPHPINMERQYYNLAVCYSDEYSTYVMAQVPYFGMKRFNERAINFVP